jgi:periplasmic divalent cation tolerance protein
MAPKQRFDWDLSEETPMDAVMIYTTWPDAAGADAAAAALVGERLAACCNMLPGMTSVYRWEGRIERGQEVVVLIKTRPELADACIAAVRRLHPYANPAALVLPVSGGSAPFLGWIADETGSDAKVSE